MKKGAYRFCSVFLAVLMLSFAAVPAYAADDYTSTGNFWQNVARKKWLSGFVGSSLIGWVCDDVCSESADKKHHGSLKTYDQNSDGSYTAICNYCSAEFPVYDADLSSAYDSYVETLPATGYDSTGRLLWQVTFEDCYKEKSSFTFLGMTPSFASYPATGLNSLCYDAASNTVKGIYHNAGTKKLGCGLQIIPPFPGSYRRVESIALEYNCTSALGENLSGNSFYSGENSFAYYSEDGFIYVVSSSLTVSVSVPSSTVCYCTFYFPIFEVIPDTAVSTNTYNINTRPTSITGGNYGIVGDNGQITRVEDNSTIVNETNNTYYNPATGATVPITGWSYDYSDRSYKVTLESGDTATITYGDENITIQEGDTIYNVYYLVDGSGSETPITPPCEHTWAETSTTPATCTMPGSKLLTCSKCQQTKTESIPALDHDWQVKQTVTTQYDDTGQLVQEGYTIFECSRCHEQYKSTDGTIPPGGGSGTGPGGDEGETIWDKLGNLIGSLGSGVIGLIEAALGKVLDALIALVNGMMERLKTVVEAVLSIFDELPKLFGGFLDFLVAVFPFLPPELMTILTFGILAVVFVAIIKAVRR